MYMRTWAWLDNIHYVDFLFPKETNSDTQLVVFHPSIPMGNVKSAPLFCDSTETIKFTVNNDMQKIGRSPVHPLDVLVETLPSDQDHVWEEREASGNKAWDNILAHRTGTKGVTPAL